MKQPKQPKAQIYTLAKPVTTTKSDASPPLNASIVKEPNKPQTRVASMCIPRACHATSLNRRGDMAANGWTLPVLPTLDEQRPATSFFLSTSLETNSPHRKALYHSPLSSLSHNKTLKMSGNSEVEYLKSLVSQVSTASLDRASLGAY